MWAKGFLDGLGSRHYYSAGSQDVNNRFAASALLYGSPLTIPIPDLNRTDFLFMVGANPLVSHGSVLSAPRIREQLNAIVDRGGRVVVVDPRRSETARAYEHLPINPDADAWMLLSMLQVLFEEGLADRGFLGRHATGADELERLVADHTPEATESRTGIPADELRQLTRDFAAAPGAAAYGRTGSCLGRFGTLVSFLLDAVNAVAGKLDRPGGAVFGNPPIALDEIAEQIGLATYDATRSRIGDFPDVLGNLPASLLPQEIETPGDTQIRALFVSAGNPVLSVPNGDALERAIEQLDLFVSLDFYVNETNRHADYVLPSTTWLERDDMPLAFLTFYATPYINQTDAVVEPAGEAREEWEIIDQIARRIGVAPYSMSALRRLAKIGVRMTPQRMVDNLLRLRKGRRSLRLAQGRPQPPAPARGAARDRAPRPARDRDPAPEDPPQVEAPRARPDPDPGGARADVVVQRPQLRVPAAADRPARAALAQLLDAQRAAADARRARARAADPPRRRGRGRPRRRRERAAQLEGRARSRSRSSSPTR